MEVVGRQAPPEAGLLDPLGVVHLVPEQRQHDHRLAVVERLGDGVVPAVGDDQVDHRQDGRLRQEPLAGLVVVEHDLVGQRPLGHDDAVLRRRQEVDQPLHEPDVGRPERAERQVDQRAVTRSQVLGQLPARVRRPDRRVEAMPRRAERAVAPVVDLGRVAVQVQPRRFGHEGGPELVVDEAVITALATERIEVGPQLAMRPANLLEEARPAGPIRGRVPGRERRDGGILELGRIARHDPDPRPARTGQRREGHDVVLDDDVGLELVEDLEQPRVDVLRAVDQRLEGRRDERLELLDGRLAEDRRGVADEVDPELARDLRLGRRGAEAHQPFLEALRLERPGERFLDDEHDPVAALAQDGADPRAVVGRTVGPFGEEHDRPGVGHRAAQPTDHRTLP